VHWLDLAGQHAVEVSEQLIRELHLSQARVDEFRPLVQEKQKKVFLRRMPIETTPLTSGSAKGMVVSVDPKSL